MSDADRDLARVLEQRLAAIARLASGLDQSPPPIGLHAAATALCTAVERLGATPTSPPSMLQGAFRYAMQQVRLVRLELESAPAERLEPSSSPYEVLATAGADAVPET